MFLIMWPYFIVSILVIAARLSFASLPKIAEYEISLGLPTIKNYFWYLLWTINIPEEFKKQVIGNLVVLNGVFVKEFYSLIIISLAAAATVIAICTYSLLTIFKAKEKLNIKLISIGIIWFLVGIAPVAILPNHYYAMYLVLASLGIYLIAAYLLSKVNKYVLTIFIAIWIFSSYTTTKFYRDSFWVAESQLFAREFTQKIKVKYPDLPSNSVVFYPLNDKRKIQALLNEDAIKVIYNDESIRIFYSGEELRQFTESDGIADNMIYHID